MFSDRWCAFFYNWSLFKNKNSEEKTTIQKKNDAKIQTLASSAKSYIFSKQSLNNIVKIINLH